MAEPMQLCNLSENNFEQCTKCSICTTVCPVAAVTTDYPGPKQAGPDGERYRMKDPAYFDKALKLCLNCKRCEVACPSGVHIADIIQRARMKATEGHRATLRDTMLANTDLLGTVANLVAPIANATLGLKPTKMVMDSVMAIDKHRTFPAYSRQKFTTWFKRHAAKEQDAYPNHVSYFHGCYVNYNFPKLGQDLVKVMNAIGYGVHMLEKEQCCGVALIANGLYKQAKRQATVNTASIRQAAGTNRSTVLTTSSSCTFNLRDEYPAMLDIDNSDIRSNISLATRFIYNLVDEEKVSLVFKQNYKRRIAYHTACHMQRMGWQLYSIELLRMIPGLDLQVLEQECCGISGTYGFKKENYERSQAIGSILFKHIADAHVEAVATDCETCKWQIEMSTGLPVENPISILADALDVEATRHANGLD
ncbi:MAG: anaerobic glycerol-3-phosphate dehydrogenase subunit C [Muribaculaceae bacterium]|nr:anaerobic glycerol-3-phosphate dehydrogenase subunit C [Muribaculaceae bacterium]